MERPDLTENERKLLDKLLGKSIVDELKTNKVLATLKDYTHGFGYPIEIINDDTEYPSHISDYTIQTISSDKNNIVIDKVVSSDIDYEDDY